jgi:hypothetical protein
MLDSGLGRSGARQGENRRHKRFAKPTLVITFGGRKLPTVNWSEGGVLLGGYTGNVSIGAKHRIVLRLEERDLPNCEARIVRRVAQQGIALTYTVLTPEARQALERLRVAQHRGRAVVA